MPKEDKGKGDKQSIPSKGSSKASKASELETPRKKKGRVEEQQDLVPITEKAEHSAVVSHVAIESNDASKKKKKKEKKAVVVSSNWKNLIEVCTPL